MKVTRRDLLLWGTGAAAGLVLTPVPWKLLGDVSIWSQNWPWIPQPTHAPVEVKRSSCTLCPKGCPMRVRLAAGWPVGVAGVPSHPLSRGALCPLGFGAHQLNWHPQRLRTVLHGEKSSSWNEARIAFAKALREGPIAIVDGYPGRAASLVFDSFAQKQGGSYHVVPSPEIRALAPYQALGGVPAVDLGYDLENARTVLSFGAPLLDGWGIPGRFNHLWAERAAGAADPQLRLIQVEDSLSRTAARAWQWAPIRAGAEAALATAMARVLLEEGRVSARVPIPALTLAEAEQQTGLSTDAIRGLARTIVARPPVVAIATDDNPSIAALNVALGAVGTRGGIVRRGKKAKSYPGIDTIGSVRAVLIDSTVPWDFTPSANAEVFRFAAWNGASSRAGGADWLLPAPGFLEELTDVPTPPTSAVETYAVAPSLVKATPEVQSAAQLLCGTDTDLATVEKTIHARCEDLFQARAGTLYGDATMPVAQVVSVEKLEEQLRSGAAWIGEDVSSERLRCELKNWPTAVDSPSSRQETTWGGPALPPLASKLYQESNLREASEWRKA